MDKFDETALQFIKTRLGGSVKARAGVKAFRYRLHNRPGMINLIHRINGNIRNSKRVVQLKKMCSVLGVVYIKPVVLTLDNA